MTYNDFNKIVKLKEIHKDFTDAESDLEMLFKAISFDMDDSSNVVIEGITPEDIQSDIRAIEQIRRKYTRGFVKAINNV